MAVPQKYQRLLKATERFNTFNHFVDIINIILFLFIALSAANKLLSKKLWNYEWLDPTWEVLGWCFGIFVVLFFTQLSKVSGRRELTPFEKEATLKAARFNRYRRRR